MPALLTLVFALASACVSDDEPSLTDEAQAVETPFPIYVSTSGNDAQLGLTPGSAVKTLARVNQILDEVLHFDETSYSGPDIEVRIAPGTYYHQTVVWTATNPVHGITFMPMNNDNVRPVFNGCTSSSQSVCNSDTFFQITKSGATNLHFKYIRVERYDNGISFKAYGPSNESNSLYGCYFYKIGNKYTSLDGGWGALSLWNSDFNRVENSHFINIENAPVENHQLHAMYVSHGSDENYIARNRFSTSNGVALKLRDDNWWNVIEYNSFSADGHTDATAGYADIPQPDEKSSCQSVFRYNVLDGRYGCAAKLPVFLLSGADTCPAPYRRLSTAGNTDDGIQCNND